MEAINKEEYKNLKNRKQLWKTLLTCDNNSSDLRSSFPYIIAGALDYIGTDTKKQISVNISNHDEKVKYIMNVQTKNNNYSRKYEKKRSLLLFTAILILFLSSFMFLQPMEFLQERKISDYIKPKGLI